MKYRINRKTGDSISEIGLGSSYMYEAGMDEAVRAIENSAMNFKADEKAALDMGEELTQRRPRQRKLENTQPFTL